MVPGRYLCGLLTPPAVGAGLSAALGVSLYLPRCCDFLLAVAGTRLCCCSCLDSSLLELLSLLLSLAKVLDRLGAFVFLGSRTGVSLVRAML